MTSSLPPAARDAFDRYITTEYATVDARQQPIVWPVTPYYEQGAPTIDVTTGIGYPKKADDAKRNPRVALLFSDPTGSGVEPAPQVLVQGTAEVDEADLAANRERYRREAVVKLPATKDMLPPRWMEGLFSWYFDRIYVKVRPERVFLWPEGDPTTEPEVYDAHVEEVRSGHSEEALEPHEPAAGGATAWDGRIEELGRALRHRRPRLGRARRIPARRAAPGQPRPRGRGWIRIGAEPAGLPVAEGRACLTAHAHAPDFKWQENFQIRGDLVRDDGGLALVPHKLIGGFEIPKESRLAGLRRNFSKARRFHRIAKERRGAR